MPKPKRINARTVSEKASRGLRRTTRWRGGNPSDGAPGWRSGSKREKPEEDQCL